MDYAWMSGPLLCVLSGFGHWLLSWVRTPCHPSTFRSSCELEKHNVLCNFTPDLYIFQVAYRQLITSFSSVTEKDLLYAANWAVSFLQVTQDVFYCYSHLKPLSGICGHHHWGCWVFLHRLWHQCQGPAGKARLQNSNCFYWKFVGPRSLWLV